MANAKTIELFLVNGTADGIIAAELSNWNGKAIKIPRIDVSNYSRDDISCPGVYFLFCKDDNNDDAVYIGEALDVKKRLLQHLTSYQKEEEEYYWNTAVVITGRNLDKALIRYLEDKLVKITRDCKRYKVLTKATSSDEKLKESKVAEMDEFADYTKVMLNALGYKPLEPLGIKDDNTNIDDEILHLNSGNITATGRVTPEGFVLSKGSILGKKVANSMPEGSLNLRNKYIGDGKVDDYKTTVDILFQSPSAAAAFVLGYSASGPQCWKTKEGKSLKEIEMNNLKEAS